MALLTSTFIYLQAPLRLTALFGLNYHEESGLNERGNKNFMKQLSEVRF